MKTVSILLLVVTSCSARVEQRSPAVSQERNSPAPLKPVAGDRSESLEADVINERAQAANLSPLKTKELDSDDLELRLWVGFGLKPLEGFVIRRTDERWEGAFLESINPTNRPPYRRELIPPVSGWEHLWSQLVASGLLVLPDSSQLKDEVGVHDGTSYVVEVKMDGVYRTYAYWNPNHQRWPEAKQMLRIANILYATFDIKR